LATCGKQGVTPRKTRHFLCARNLLYLSVFVSSALSLSAAVLTAF
jgi:hypothetical protein